MILSRLDDHHTAIKSLNESVISFSIICWHGSLCDTDKTFLRRIVRVASTIAGVNSSGLVNFSLREQVLRKAKSIGVNAAHLSPEYKLLLAFT